MRDETNNPDLETSIADGQRSAGGSRKSGSHEKPFRTQGTGKRRGNSSSDGLKNLFTSPFPYLFMAILLIAILLFYGNRDTAQTAAVRDNDQFVQTQGGNQQDGSLNEPQPENPQTENPQPVSPQTEDPQLENPPTEIPQTEVLQSGIPQPGITEGYAQAENPGENLQEGYQTGDPRQEALTENLQPGNPNDAPAGNMNGPDAGDGTGQAGNQEALAQSEAGQAADWQELTQNEDGTAGARQDVPADNVNQGGENTDSTDREGDNSVPVQSITITAGTDVMAQCDTLQLTAAISPSNADNTALLWFSDDETIARVSQDGLVTSVSAGYTVISAVSSNGIQTDFPITVSSSRKVMTLTVSTECTQNDKVGNNWTYRYLMNGTPVHAVQNMMVEAGKTISLESEIIEHDEQPDLGSAENNYSVRQSDLEDGFEITQDVYVQENRPKLAGNTASFVVTYRFSDAVE